MRKQATTTTLNPEAARIALIQLARADLAGVLGYAEGLGLVAAALGVWGDPATIVRRTCLAIVDGTTPWNPDRMDLPSHVRELIWREMEQRIGRCADAVAGQVSRAELRLSAVQLGSLDGVTRAARWTASRLADDRRTDPSVLELADLMLGELHNELHAIIRRADLDAAPIVAGRRDDAEGTN
ncbi:MAG: hypothetical protein R3B06_07975 [Kofleriaceae bacterium]